MLKNLRKKKKGFTLIELIIVIAILAILAAVALPRLGGFKSTAEKSAELANAKTIANAAAVLYANNELEADGKEVVVDDNSKVGGYLQDVPTDSKGGNFKVIIDEKGNITVQNSKSKQVYPEKELE